MTTKKHPYMLDQSVMWDNDPEDAGIVRAFTDTAVLIDWDHSEPGWLDYRDLDRVSPLPNDWEKSPTPAD